MWLMIIIIAKETLRKLGWLTRREENCEGGYWRALRFGTDVLVGIPFVSDGVTTPVKEPMFHLFYL